MLINSNVVCPLVHDLRNVRQRLSSSMFDLSSPNHPQSYIQVS